MTKALIKYFLSLLILLLCVYSQLYARTYPGGIFPSSKITLLRSENASFGIGQNSQAQLLKPVLYGTENQNCKIVATEIEEEKHEWISFKKYLESSNYFTTVFYVLAFGCFCLFFKKRLPSCKRSIYFSSYKWYLLFRVIRIWFRTSGGQFKFALPSLILIFFITKRP